MDLGGTGWYGMDWIDVAQEGMIVRVLWVP
jgi:hypothetical protein